LVDALAFDKAPLLPAIVRQYDTGEILMQAWMNEDALIKTLTTGDVWYYSRSRQALWRKGESSGNTQRLIALRTDCDYDSLLLDVDQTGPACHTNRPHCFFHLATKQGAWEVTHAPEER
jgi:phosphoribosyl-AMP cyclohydrolase